MNIAKFWTIFAVGVAAGAVVALIYAPQSGEETRRQLKEKYDETADQIRDRAGDWADAASDYAGRASEYAGKFYKKGREVAEGYASDAQSAARSTVERAKDFGGQAL
jgi:gas vesicle protein